MLFRWLLLALLCFASPAFGQSAGAITNHAFAIGKGPGVTGVTSLLCGAGQVPYGRGGLDPGCQNLFGAAGLTNGQLQMFGQTSGSGGVQVTATGGLVLYNNQGSQNTLFNDGANGTAFIVGNAGGTIANQLLAIPSTAGSGPTLLANGSDTNINLNLNPKGTGVVSAANSVTIPTGKSYQINGTTVVDALAWTSYTPTITCNTGTITTLGTVGGRYKAIGKTVNLSLDIGINTNGTCAGGVNATLPLTANSGGALAGREANLTGKMLSGQILPAGTVALILNYDNTYPGATNARFILSGVYESQ